jgi:hypothetical protein
MKTMSRISFLVTANVVWLALFTAEVLAVLAPDYVAWWRPAFQQSCSEDAYRYDLSDRLFMFGLIWLITAPLMSLIAWRIPEHWPLQVSRIWWNAAAPALSVVTAAGAVALMLWPLTGVVYAPVTSKLVLEAARAVLLLGVVLYYRAVILSA